MISENSEYVQLNKTIMGQIVTLSEEAYNKIMNILKDYTIRTGSFEKCPSCGRRMYVPLEGLSERLVTKN